MATLTRRLQVLLDEPRFARLEAEALARNTTIAALVREALDGSYPLAALSVEAAAARLLDRDPIDFGEWGDVKAQIEWSLARTP